MQCPKCGFLMSAFDEDCPRCKNLANQPQVQPPTQPQTQQPTPIPQQQALAQQTTNTPIANQNQPVTVQCQKCFYMLSPTDIECPRCKKVKEGHDLEKGALSAKTWETLMLLAFAFFAAIIFIIFILSTS